MNSSRHTLSWRVISLLEIVALVVLLAIGVPSSNVKAPTAFADPYPPYWDGGLGTAIHYAPVAWPSDGQWLAYTRGGDPIYDPRTQDPSNGGTRPQNYVNVSSGCPDQSLPSVYYAYNSQAQMIFFRFRIEQVAVTYGNGPQAATYSNSDPWNAGTWSVLIDTDGDGYRNFVLMLDGQTGTPSQPVDRLVSIYSPTSNNYVGPLTDPNIHELEHNPTGFVDQASGKILNFHNSLSPDTNWPYGAAETVWDYGTTRFQNISTASCTEFIVDYQIPLDMLDASGVGGPVVTADTPISMIFATANSNTNPLQKDAVSQGDYIANPEAPAPFGDVITLGGGGVAEGPVVTSLSASGCGPVSLSGNVLDAVTMSGGLAQTVVTSANFYYYFDADADGLADDGTSWTLAATGATTNSPVGYWTASWNSSTLAKGQYLIGLTATNSYGQTVNSWSDNPTPEPGLKTVIVNNNCGTNPPNIAKTVTPSYVAASGTVTYTVVISNPTASAVTVSAVTDTLPTGFSFGTASGTLLPATTSPTLGQTGEIVWTFSPAVSIGATSSKNLIFTATASDTAGSYQNDVSAATSYGVLDTDLTAQVDVGAPYLDISKSVSSASVSPGSNVTFTITYGNSSAVAATNVVISDVLPAGTTFVSATGGGTHSAGTVTWNIGSLASGSAGNTVQLVLSVDGSYSGVNLMTNTATIASAENSPASASVSTYINVLEPVLVLRKSGDTASVSPGGSVTYTLTYTNVGNTQATGVVLTDAVPTGFTAVSASGGATVSPSVVTWTIGTLDSGASASQTVTAAAGNPFAGANPGTNTAYLSASGLSTILSSYAVGVNSTATQCYIDYFHDVTQVITTTGTQRIANTTAPTNPTAATINFAVTKTATEFARFYSDPPNTQYQSFPTPITTTIYITQPSGAQVVYRADLYDFDPANPNNPTLLGTASSPTTSGAKNNLAINLSITPGGPVANGHRFLWVLIASVNGGSQTVTFGFDATGSPSGANICISPPPSLVVDKVPSTASLTPPSTINYTIRFANTGAIGTTGTVLTDTLPAGVSYVAGSATLNGAAVTPGISGDVLTFTVNSTDQVAGSGIVSGGQQGSVSFQGQTGTIAPSVASFTNTVQLGSVRTSVISDTAATLLTSPSLSLSKAASAALLEPGDVVTFTLTLLNSGSGVSSGIVVTDVLTETAYFTYVSGSASPAATYSASPNRLVWSGLSLQPGASTSLTFRMQVASSGVPSGNTEYDNSATASDATGNTTASDVAQVTISSNPNLTIAKQVDPSGTLSAGDTVTYTVTYGNTGGSDALLTTIRDSLPSYMSYVTGSLKLNGVARTDASDGDNAAYDAVNNLVTWSPGTVAAGSTGNTATFKAKVSPLVPDGDTSITNQATIAAQNAASKSASVISTAAGQVVLTLTKTGPATLAYPPTTLAAAASGATTISVNNASLLSVGDVIKVGGTTATIDSVDTSTNSVGLSTAVTGAQGDPVYGTIKFYITYENTGSSQATNVKITDTLPAGLSYVSASTGATVNGQVVTWSKGMLDPNVPGQVWVIATPSGPGTYTNEATIGSAETGETSDSAATQVGAPLLSKSTLSPTVSQTLSGTSATYVITVTNQLATPITGVIVTDTLPSGYSFSSTSSITGYSSQESTIAPSVGDNPVKWGSYTIAGSSSMIITFVAAIGTSVGTATFQNSVEATTSSGTFIGFDPLVTTVEDVTVQQPAVIISNTTSTPSVINTVNGTTATYTLVLRNTGTADATGVIVTDSLPLGFTYLSTDSISGNATRTGELSPTLGSSAPAWGSWTIPATTGVLTITYTVAIAAEVPDGTYDENASASSDITTIPNFDTENQESDDVTTSHSPTAVTVMSVEARFTSSGVLVLWATGSEVDTLGFNIWRSDRGGELWTRLNAQIIPAQGVGGITGGSYAYVDGSVVQGQMYQYWLESVSPAGEVQWIGPVWPEPDWPHRIYMPLIRFR
ncbi:MAG: DUF11 domain-containing protein [Chloroflexi bacterium]|nr:DUF11 domain-containing protein [Chloroflexota bacterium]